MYIRPKKAFWSLVLLLALLYVGAHLVIRASWVRGQVLQRLSARIGYAVSASDVRFTPGLALSFRDFRLDRPASAGVEARTVAEAPWLRLGRHCCGGWSVRAPRVRLEAFREAGVWTPSQATGADECPGACVFPRISSAFGNLFFDLSDAQVAFEDGGARTAFVGVSWTRAPVRIPGRPGAVQDRLSWLKGPIRGDATADLATRGSDEWYELPGGIARLAIQGGSVAVEPRADSAEGVVGGGENAPSAVFAPDGAPAAKEDMVAAFREFFQTDPETAKAFFDAVDEARAEAAKPNAETTAPSATTPEPAKKADAETAPPAADGAAAPGGTAPEPAKKADAETAQPAADGAAASGGTTPEPAKKADAETAQPAADEAAAPGGTAPEPAKKADAETAPGV